MNNVDKAWWSQYHAYLESEHWQTIRKRVLARDLYVCQNCFRQVGQEAHVHHLSYDGFNRTGRSFAFECITLCPSCHSDYHGGDLQQPYTD